MVRYRPEASFISEIPILRFSVGHLENILACGPILLTKADSIQNTALSLDGEPLTDKDPIEAEPTTSVS